VRLDGGERRVPRVAETTGLRTPAKPPTPLKSRRPSRLVLLWRRKRRLVWPALGLCLIGGLAFAGYSTVRGLQRGNSIADLRERIGIGAGLTVNQIIIQDREKTPEPLLRAALGVSRGDKLLGFSLEAARQRIAHLPWVQDASVERRLPDTIVVKLTERSAIAVWQNAGRFVLIDAKGNVVVEQDPRKDPEVFAALPLVVGPGAPEKADELLKLLAAMPALKTHVVAAIRVGERRWNLRLNNNVDVLLPEEGQEQAMNKLVELQASQSLLDRPLQAIDLRQADRLVVRPLPQTAPTPSAPNPARRPT
jgi:cell division protein FtsQ